MLKTRILNACQATAVATALCATSFLAPTAAHAASPVEPSHDFEFVVDNDACAFPVQWAGSTGYHGIETPYGFISLSPGWSVTFTNLDTGATWSPAGNGAIAFRDLPDGTTIQTLDGVNYAPRLEEQLIGHWTRTLSDDGVTEFVGSGKIVSICDMLS